MCLKWEDDQFSRNFVLNRFYCIILQTVSFTSSYQVPGQRSEEVMSPCLPNSVFHLIGGRDLNRGPLK
jgi:hypothetical protein